MPTLKNCLAVSILITVVLLQGCAAAVIGGVAAGSVVIHDRRSAGTVIDDQGMELKAVQVLQESPFKGSNISITSYNHTVLLTGEVPKSEIAEQFARRIGQIQDVRRVVNEVTVGPNSTLSEDSHDTYLTSKAKAALFDVKLEGFDPTRVKIVTQKGTVFLMGLVTSHEATAVTEEVRYLRGVKRVVKVFEYTDQRQ